MLNTEACCLVLEITARERYADCVFRVQAHQGLLSYRIEDAYGFGAGFPVRWPSVVRVRDHWALNSTPNVTRFSMACFYI
jgi:hypothetical protein